MEAIIGYSALATAIVTFIYMIGTFLLWNTTRKSVSLLSAQVAFQQKQLRSAANSQIVAAHRDLFLNIIKDNNLLSALISGKDDHKSRFLASILINHCSSIFDEYRTGTLEKESLENFIDDAADLFGYDIVFRRWQSVKGFHDNEFSLFINEKVLPRLATTPKE